MAENRFIHGWCQVLAALLLQGVSVGSVYYGYSVAAASFGEAFQPSRMMLMLGMTCIMATSGVIAPWLGAWIDRYSMRLMMLIGALCLSGGYLALSFVTAMWQVLLVYGSLIAVATTLAGPLAASTLLARWFSRRRAMALGIAAVGTSLGGFVFPPLMQWLIDGFEWRVGFRWLSAGIFVTTVPWIALLVIDRPADRGLYPDGAATAPSADGLHARQAQQFSTMQAFLRERSFWVIALVAGTLTAVHTAMLANLVPFALDSGAAAARAALLLSLVAGMSIAGKLAFGVLGDHIDLRAAYGVAIVLVCAGLSCFIVGDRYAWLAVGSLLLGLAGGGMLPIWGGLIGRAFGPDNYGRAMGLMTPVITLLALIAPPLAGHIHDITGSYQFAFGLFIAALAAALLTLPLIVLGTRMPVAAVVQGEGHTG